MNVSSQFGKKNCPWDVTIVLASLLDRFLLLPEPIQQIHGATDALLASVLLPVPAYTDERHNIIECENSKIIQVDVLDSLSSWEWS